MNIFIFIIPLLSVVAATLPIYIIAKMTFYPKKPFRVFGWTLQGFMPKAVDSTDKYINKISDLIITSVRFEDKLVSAAMLERIMPLADQHMDHFLRVKLNESMPMIGMFIGDKTIIQLKSIFLEELRILFPSVMQNYVAGLKDDVQVNELFALQLKPLLAEKILPALEIQILRKIHTAIIISLIFGLIVGLLQVWIYLYT